MTTERPAVVTRLDIRRYIGDRDVERAVRELQRTGWIAPLHLKSVWAFFPPGEDEVTDPYIDLRGWRARDPRATFALAGESAAWHLGYLARQFNGPVSTWIPEGERAPHGLRSHLSVVTLGWDRESGHRLTPGHTWLRKRGLDLTRWSSGLPAFGPEALLVQLAARPSSFRAWADLVPALHDLAGGVASERLLTLLDGQSVSTWQRAAYLLHCGRQPSLAKRVLDDKPGDRLHHVALGRKGAALWSPAFGVTDHIVAPLQGLVGKA
jgi:hypothetical protein